MEEIMMGDTSVDVDDLPDMNKTELVKLLRKIEIPAHRGLEKKTLISLAKGEKQTIHNKVDEYRSAIVEFLRQHWLAVESQLEVKCKGDCFEHTDFQVVTCWKTNREIIERYR